MNSDLPKVLHELAGRPLLEHVLERAVGLGPERIHVVVGEDAALVRARFPGFHAHWGDTGRTPRHRPTR